MFYFGDYRVTLQSRDSTTFTTNIFAARKSMILDHFIDSIRDPSLYTFRIPCNGCTLQKVVHFCEYYAMPRMDDASSTFDLQYALMAPSELQGLLEVAVLMQIHDLVATVTNALTLFHVY